MKTKDLVLISMYSALFLVLDVLANQIPLFKMPQGGSIGLGTLAILLASYHLGWKKGIAVGLISLPLQFITGPVYFVSFIQYLLDYVIGFVIYGVASLVPYKRNDKVNGLFVAIGVLLVNLVRFGASTISGVVYYGYSWVPSMEYQMVYLLPTAILGMVMVPILLRTLRPIFDKYK